MLKSILKEKNMSVYRCCRLSGIPYMTLLDLVNGNTDISKCSSSTLYSLAKTLDISMEALYESCQKKPAIDFDVFRSTICHEVKNIGELQFILNKVEENLVIKLWKDRKYKESLYVLAMVDYLSRKNNITLVEEYDEIRNNKLKDTVYPKDILILDKLYPHKRIKEKALRDSIPEFLKFNIVETEVLNVY